MPRTLMQKRAARRRRTQSKPNHSPARSKAWEGSERPGNLKAKLEPTVIPGTEDGTGVELSPVEASMPETGDLARLLATTPRELRGGDIKASERYARKRLLPHLLVLQHGPTMAGYMLAAAVFHVVRLLHPLRRDERRVRAIKRALGFASGDTPYLQLLNGLAPPPKEDGSGARKAAQNRHSNVNRALMAAEGQGLNAPQLLQRLIHNGGFEKLVEEARADDAKGEGEEKQEGASSGEPAPFMKRSERRKQARADKHRKEDDGWSNTGLGTAAKRVEGKGEALAVTASSWTGSGGDKKGQFAELEASSKVRAQISGGGEFLMKARATPGEDRLIVKIKLVTPWPEHGYDADREALTAMVDAVRI